MSATFQATHTIISGFGYWDITNYPIGGCFRRATEPLLVEYWQDPQFVKGYGHLAFFKDSEGRKIACGESSFQSVE